MAELTIDQLIKILIGVFVIVVVAVGLYFFFKNYVMGFFKNLPETGTEAKLILSLLK
jgi:hypothetical protein